MLGERDNHYTMESALSIAVVKSSMFVALAKGSELKTLVDRIGKMQRM